MKRLTKSRSRRRPRRKVNQMRKRRRARTVMARRRRTRVLNLMLEMAPKRISMNGCKP